MKVVVPTYQSSSTLFPSAVVGLRMSSDETVAAEDTARVWLVERTYGDDEQNLIILTYATPDGTRDFRKERALTSFTGDHRETAVSLTVDPDNLGSVDEAATRDRYAAEVERMREQHDPDDSL